MTFIARDKDGRIDNGWNPEATGDYSADVKLGSAMADEAVAYLKSSDDVPAFARVMRDAGRAKQGPVEIGFMSRIALILQRARLEVLSGIYFALRYLNKIPVIGEVAA